MLRKLTIIGLILLIAATVSYFLYTKRRVATLQEAAPTVSEETPRAVELLPSTEVATAEIETDGLHLVAPLQILDYWIDAGDHTAYLTTEDGTVYSVAPDGGEPVQIFRIPGMASSSIVGIKSNGNTAAALVEYRSSDNKKAFSVIDPILNTTRFLPLGTTAATWSPTGKEIVYLQDRVSAKDTSAALYSYAPTTNTSKRLTFIDVIDPVLTWLEGGEIIIGTRMGDSSEGVEWRYNLKTKALIQSGAPTRGLTTRWNKNGTLGLRYTAVNSSALEIINASGKSMMSWDRATLPEKCFFDATAILCATPTNSFLPSRIRDPYLQRALYTNDTLVKVPLVNALPSANHATTLLSPDSSVSIDAYHLEKIGTSLHFINRYDQRLYSFKTAE